MPTLRLDGRSLSLDDLAPLARGAALTVSVTKDAKAAVKRARKLVEDHVAAGDVVYGLTTGFGKLKSVAIATEDLETLQKNLVLSHCCGVGEPMLDEEVRIAQVLRLNGLVRGHSGVRDSLVDALVRLFNKGFTPVVPQQGSVGASGDLAPLSTMAATYMGYGKARIGGKTKTAKAALKDVGEEPIVLQAKEGLALINGTEIMKAVGVRSYLRALNLSKAADVIASLSLEALLGSLKPFDDRLATLKGNEGHRRTSANLRKLLEGSGVLASHADCDRVQDPYSLRCIPQVHGSYKTAIAHVGDVLSCEINAVTDNPVIFPETGETVSAGQFHGQPVSMVLDYLGMAACTIANISERRIEQLVNPDLSGLPAFLTPKPGLNSGMMIAQVAAAALASENKVLAHPASVDTVPTSANQEDHVSMGVTAARKGRQILDNVENVLAIELLCAAQGREFHTELTAGTGADAAHRALRKTVKALTHDRFLQPDIEAARELIASGALVAAVEAAVGPLDA
ncbi:MAG: histidine ammonia-lyase [Planctomycetes bacterium]|nr:histidine ammonia-lyase [Planctomycetota bacterium]MCB9903377.1 histidine ammonia-lyase [Planctomycetota bacterium]